MEGTDKNASTSEECEASCCSDPTCTAWQFSSVIYNIVGPGTSNGCYLGINSYDPSGNCETQNDDTWDYVGGAGRPVPTAAPSAAPSAAGGISAAVGTSTLPVYGIIGIVIASLSMIVIGAWYVAINRRQQRAKDQLRFGREIKHTAGASDGVNNPISFPSPPTAWALRLSEAYSVGPAELHSAEVASYPTAPPIADVELTDFELTDVELTDAISFDSIEIDDIGGLED